MSLEIVHRAYRPLALKHYKRAGPLPDIMFRWPAPVVPAKRQYILRMMVRNECGWMAVPKRLQWLQPWITRASYHQEDTFNRNLLYVYVTVRHGKVTSTTDDVWHVDGFSMRKPHVPEHNYLYTDLYPTQVLNQSFTIPQDFDPLKHNIHNYFQQHAGEKVWTPDAGKWILLDPYVVHRRPIEAVGKVRTMIRISFVPIPIEDDENTPNPLLPAPHYGNRDFRKELVAYG